MKDNTPNDTTAWDEEQQANARYLLETSKDMNNEWFQYVGSNMQETRPFCLEMTEKRWIHRSEIPEIAAQDWEGKIPGTNAENFRIYRGGYGCRHHIYPVSANRVPPEIREKFSK